jgi:sucrose phosphorylase
MTARGVDLLVYADRLGGDLPRLRALLDGPFRDFAGVHILPFFVPFDGADAGFDPIDHGTVDPRLGTWEDVRAIATSRPRRPGSPDGPGAREVTADLIVNHVSSESAEFVDWLARGDASPHDGMFLTFDTVFPDGANEHDITAFYRPRPGLPFTAYRMADGRRRLVWTTFMPSQVDLDVHNERARDYLRRILAALRDGGVTTVRLDAVGYAVKTPGSDSFMTEETLAFVREIVAIAREAGLRVLVEVHAHYSQQLAIAPLVDLVYDFALAPLLLHSLGTGTTDRLLEWFRIRPQNAVTVLDTHDGIGIIDAGPSGDLPGLIDQAEMAAIFERAAVATGGHSTIASVIPAWMSLPHQINATFFSVLGGDATAYLLARAVQLWLPGHPQLYYVGLLGGLDDVELFRRTGQGRDVNRHVYTPEELEAALASEVTRAQLALVRLRSTHPAFEGGFGYRSVGDAAVELEWRLGDERATLTVSFADGTAPGTAPGTGTAPAFRIDLDGSAGPLRLDSVAALAAL